MSDFLDNYREIYDSLRDTLADERGEYTLTFVQDFDGRWYVDIPWDGDRGDLEMVEGADDMLTYLDSENEGCVTLHIIPSDYPLTEEEYPGVAGHYEMPQIDESFRGGAHYETEGWPGFYKGEVWFCPVTLCVLGRYPAYLYVKKVSAE